MEEKSSYLGNEKFESIMRKNYEIYTLGAAIILDRDTTVHGQPKTCIIEITYQRLSLIHI